MRLDELKPGVTITGPLFPESVQVILVTDMGTSVKLIGKGLRTEKLYDPILSEDQLANLTGSSEREPYDGDPVRFRLGIEALRLGLAYEYDPYFSLSIARVDPLPHQLEAVYDYFLRLPRIRFLLADDPGAGKTIMAGLLIKELKVRGLVKRILIVTPANLHFQWQRELKDKFQEKFEVVRSDVLRANYGSNPWQEKNQVITSISWVSRIEDAKESLLRSHWDLIIVDEAHKMSAYSSDKKTLAYELGEKLSEMTDHYLLMTATPHKGDPENFRLFLQLLDRDVYGDVASIDEAIRRHEAPFYLRRVKEALVHFPTRKPARSGLSSQRGKSRPSALPSTTKSGNSTMRSLVTSRTSPSRRRPTIPRAAARLGSRWRCCNAGSPPASGPPGEAWSECGTSARRSWRIPRAYRQQQIDARVPDDFDDLPEEEQQEIMAALEEAVVSVDPIALKDEIGQLDQLDRAGLLLEKREVESKLRKLVKCSRSRASSTIRR